MPNKDDLIKKAQQKFATPANQTGKNLQSVRDKLKLMHKGPSGPRPAAPVSVPPPVSLVPDPPKVIELPQAHIPAPPPDVSSLPQGIEGSLSFDDLKAKRYNQSMEYLVPIEWIDFQDSEHFNPKGTYNRDTFSVLKESYTFKSLVEDIKENGQQIPGRVRVNEHGLLIVTDGWRRALASRESGRGVYLCTIKDESDEEAAINALRLNLMREDLPEYNKLYEIKKLNEVFNLTYEVIAKKSGFGTKTYISDCLSIFDVPAVEEALKKKQVSISTGRHLARKALKDKLTPEQTEKMVKKVVSREIQLKDLKFLDAKNETQKPKIVHTPNFKLKEDGSFNYPSINFKPHTINLRDIEKTISNLEEMIKILRKEVKDRRN